MFFIMGITDGQKRFDFTQVMICGLCGKYGRCEVFMTYTCLTPVFYSMFPLESSLLCADDLLQRAL